MDLKEIKKLIALVENANISEIEVEQDGTKIGIKKNNPAGTHVVSEVLQHAAPAPIQVQPQAASPIQEAVVLNTESKDTSHGLVSIKAEMVGTFYSAASPDDAPFIKVGDSIEPGKVICIIEAMKLFNEIESEVSGTIEKVCAVNGDMIEFGQELFLVRPA